MKTKTFILLDNSTLKISIIRLMFAKFLYNKLCRFKFFFTQMRLALVYRFIPKLIIFFFFVTTLKKPILQQNYGFCNVNILLQDFLFLIALHFICEKKILFWYSMDL